ncbi:MAG TPA: hypothetical protein VMF51_11215 [Nocardioides sp.]|uniref:hypothetical protein n=1 Tax=Nocardioides sp. TaxID=35761 RepID=UPI002BE14984|nr:hypothetical protein [Nocardioides sp.]HTW15692.1 hypothetical protein [Nocardioides sp.]
MKTSVALAALLLTLTACGSGDDEPTAVDPGPQSAAMPSAAPVPAGPVRTVRLATVLDTGEGAELCLGPVAESFPPQCSGLAITNWDWAEHGQEMFDEQDPVRWGTYAVTGRWDGTAFEVTDTIPGPLYDAMAPEPSPTPSPAASYSDAELESVAADLRALPGAQGAASDGTTVTADVLYDDGTLQAWADEEYGAGVVLVSSLLVED